MKDRVELKFMVVPEELSAKAYVPNAVHVRVVEPEEIFLLGILGESGRELVRKGVSFYFEGELAERLISKGIMERVPEPSILIGDRGWADAVAGLKTFMVLNGRREVPLGPVAIENAETGDRTDASVVSVRHAALKDVTPDEVLAFGSSSSDDLFDWLRQRDPDVTWDSEVTMVTWRLG